MTTVRKLNAELQQVACEELNEVESRIPEDILALRTWIEKQPHLRARTDDQFLVAFLRGCKYSLEKAKSKIDHYYTIKTMLPEIFANNKMAGKSIDLCRSGTYVSLPMPLGAGGPRIQFTNYAKFDPKTFCMNDLFRYQTLLFTMQVHTDDNRIISGYLEVMDLSKMNLSLLLQFDPVLVRKLAVFAEKAQPMRLKGLHFINAPKEAQAILSLARNLMSAKLQKRFFVHKNMDELYKVIPKEYLPIEYGGTNGSIAEIQAETEKQLFEFNDYFSENENYGVDENLRPGKKVNMDSLFGIDGSFRKLDID